MAEIPLGLLGFAAGAMGAGGPSNVPMGFGQALSGGLLSGLNAYGQMQGVQNDTAQRQMRQMQLMQQMKAQQQAQAQDTARQEYLNQYASTLPPEQQALARIAPEALIEAQVESQFRTPEPPKSRQRAVGGVEVFEEWNPQSLRWEEVSQAPRWNPDRGPLSVTNINTPFESEYDKARGRSMAEAAAAIQEAGRSAEEQLAAIGPLMASLANPDVYQGTAGPAISGLKRFGGTMLGLDFEGVGDAEVARTLGNQMAMSMRSMLPGPMSDGDRAFLQSLPPNLGNSREGNVLIGEFYRRGAERNAERAQAAREYEARTGRLDPGFDREWAEYMRSNPMFDETDYTALQEVARSTPQPTPTAGMPDDITDILGRYGVGGN